MKINVNNNINKQNKINFYNLKNNDNSNKIINEINNMDYKENLALIKSNKELKNYHICLNFELKFYKNLISNKKNNIE